MNDYLMLYVDDDLHNPDSLNKIRYLKEMNILLNQLHRYHLNWYHYVRLLPPMN